MILARHENDNKASQDHQKSKNKNRSQDKERFTPSGCRKIGQKIGGGGLVGFLGCGPLRLSNCILLNLKPGSILSLQLPFRRFGLKLANLWKISLFSGTFFAFFFCCTKLFFYPSGSLWPRRGAPQAFARDRGRPALKSQDHFPPESF